MYLFTPKFWYGSEIWALGRVLARKGLRISPARLPALIIGGYCALCNSVLALACYFIFARRISRVRFSKDPILIIGHWRSGTTFLHELLSMPPQHTAPNGYQCFIPGHFLLTQQIFQPVLRLLTLRNRPMDAMKLDIERPQEDEFAILNTTGLSNYDAFIIPGDVSDRRYLTLKDATAQERQLWQSAWMHFLKSVQLMAGEDRRLILKSPQHTARIALILQLFPNAKFVHLARDPAAIYLSTLHTWRAMINEHALEPSDGCGDRLPGSVLETFEEMYRSYQDDISRLSEDQLCELRYEDLVADPLGALQTIFTDLRLDGFEEMRPHFEARISESRRYKAATVASDPQVRRLIAQRFQRYIERFGYSQEYGQPFRSSIDTTEFAQPTTDSASTPGPQSISSQPSQSNLP